MMSTMNNNMMINPKRNQINNNNIAKRKINDPNNIDVYYERNDYITSISRDIFSQKDDIKFTKN